MFKRECSLCGGKLNGNICTECGLDNSKSDEQYKMYGGHRDYDELTHVHEKVNPFAGKTLTKEQKQEMKTAINRRKQAKNTGSYSGNINTGKTVKKKGSIAKVISILLIIYTIAGLIGGLVNYLSYGSYEEVYVEPEYYDPYEYVNYDLPETGEHFEIVLEPGVYKGGVHIPEGAYYLEVVSGTGSINMVNDSIGVYVDYWLDVNAQEEDMGTVSYVDDFRVYAGSRIMVQEEVMVVLVTENANLPLYYSLNPNTESAVVSEKFEVGRDVPAGVYDIECVEGGGVLEYYVEHEDGYLEYFGIFIGKGDSYFPEVFRNVVLPEGTLVEIPEMTIRLTPSEIIESEEYLMYYD